MTARLLIGGFGLLLGLLAGVAIAANVVIHQKRERQWLPAEEWR
jgi:ABC-type lipoprotein release transport system permease subunit